MTNAIVQREDTDIEVPPGGAGAAIEIAQTRAAQEVQAAMTVAKRFPRDENVAFARVMRSCQRPGLAEVACYAYPRGDQTVTGPSIKLAQALAQSWGNIDYGWIELEQRRGYSQVMAYAWDLETNTRRALVFTVKHERHTRKGITLLTDPRDIYEVCANQAARRVRSCILGVIPGDLIEAAVVECDKTLAGQSKEPFGDRLRKMVAAFDKIGVKQERVEKRLGHKIDSTSETELVTLGKIYRTITDNEANPNDYFEPDTAAAADSEKKSKAEQMKDALRDETKG
jgi:hypothetical protein